MEGAGFRSSRGLAGAVLCAVSWAFKSSQWHTSLFEEKVVVDMRVVCPQDVKKMLLKQARMVYWKRWVVTHECEELKDGVGPIQATLKTNEAWTDKHRHVPVVEGGRVQKDCMTLVCRTRKSAEDETKKAL